MKPRELLGFAAVAALLAALVVPRVKQNAVRARQQKAARDIVAISTALDKYRIDNGRYPTQAQGLEALRTEPKTPPLPRHWLGPYLEKPVPRDPWGRPYVYVVPGKHNPRRFDLFSKGADGKEGGRGEAADVGNWD